MLEMLGPFFIGAAGSLHCVGMCGPIVVAYSLQRADAAGGARAGLGHHLIFHLGRLSSYMLLGAVAGVVAHLMNLEAFMGQLRSWVSLLAGTTLVLMGLVLTGSLPFPGRGQGNAGAARWVSRFLGARSLAGKLGLGVATGFLPCMLPWAMMVKAASSGGMLEALAIMALFGLGTVPALLFLGISASSVSSRFRLVGERIAALGVILMGSLLFYKGAKALFHLKGLAG